jgi:acyl-CoA thioester hydrolase
VHRFDVHVRWNDCDPYGHVNHATYLAYFETARIEAMGTVGWSMNRLSELGLMVVVANLEARFLRPAEFDDRLVVITGIARIGRASSVWTQSISRDEERIATARVVGATVDGAGRPRRSPAALHDALRALRVPNGEPRSA